MKQSGDAEQTRLSIVRAVNVLDTPPEAVFDRLTRILAHGLNVPIALLTLVDAKRIWFKSAIGLDCQQTARENALCAHAILGVTPLLIDDATKDRYFRKHPLVTGAPHIRFYAGVPLLSRDGHAFGTLCAIDTVPRQLSAQQVQTLQDLADMATHELQRREGAGTLDVANPKTAIEQLSHQLRERETELSAILDYTTDAYVAMDTNSHITAWNQMAVELFGWTRAEALGQPMHEMIIPEHLRQRHLNGMQRFIQTGEERVLGTRVELEAIRKDGSTVPVEVHINALKTGDKIMFNAFLHEITQRKQREDSLRQEALHDPLTGLPNRRALYDAIPLLIEQANASGTAFSALFLDLDGFKEVNDRFGHDVGDELLKEVAIRLRHSLRTSDLVYRLAGDEFTILLVPIDDHQALERVAEKILQTIRQPFQIDDLVAQVQISIGITVFHPGDSRSPTQLVKDADIAMYRAKQNGRNGYSFFDPDTVNHRCT